MTQEEFKALGTAQHYKILVEWGGKKWRLTKTVQATKTCFLNGVNGRLTKKSIATSYERVIIIDNS